MNIVLCLDLQIDPGVLAGVLFAAGDGFFRAFAAPDLNGFVDRERESSYLAGGAGRQCDGDDFVAKGDLPLIIMKRRTAVKSIFLPGTCCGLWTWPRAI